MTSGASGAAGRPLPTLRIRFKKVFTRYYLELCSSGVATPTDAYEACADYLAARDSDLGIERALVELGDDIAGLTGEIEQDLRRHHRGVAAECLAREPLDQRVDECVRGARSRARSGPPAPPPPSPVRARSIRPPGQGRGK